MHKRERSQSSHHSQTYQKSCEVLVIPIFDQVPGLGFWSAGLVEIINYHNYYSSMIFSLSSERGLVASQT